MKIPQSKFGQFCFFFISQFISYFLIVANTRAYTQARYFWTALTDAFIAAQSFVMIRIISKQDGDQNLWAGLGYVIGGTIGSLVSIWITKLLYGA